MKNYKAIIFDLGGVILNIDYLLTINEFEKLGIENASNFYSKKVQNPIFDKIEVGAISSKEFMAALKKKCNNTSLEQVENAWNAMLSDLPQNRLTLIKKLKNKYKIFLLSNTNEIHMQAFQNKIGVKTWGEFSALFDKMYLSFEIGFRKPDKSAFKIILKENSLKPNEVLFIDDSPQHIETAKRLGMNCYYLLDEEDVTTIFPDITL
jgi:putative hydrolase of the HAD superfamily